MLNGLREQSNRRSSAPHYLSQCPGGPHPSLLILARGFRLDQARQVVIGPFGDVRQGEGAACASARSRRDRATTAQGRVRPLSESGPPRPVPSREPLRPLSRKLPSTPGLRWQCRYHGSTSPVIFIKATAASRPDRGLGILQVSPEQLVLGISSGLASRGARRQTRAVRRLIPSLSWTAPDDD